jgi:hypothetical protein
MKRRIVLIKGSGYKSGKDTAAAFIANELHRGRPRLILKGMFAYTVKKLAESLTGMKMIDLNTPEKEHCLRHPFRNPTPDFSQVQKETYLTLWGMTLGRMLQLLATEGMRNNFDKDIHVKAEAIRINNLVDEYAEGYKDITVIISDWRFPNEEKLSDYLIGDWEVHLVEVFRNAPDEDPNWTGSNTGRDMMHESESYEMNSGHEISNNGSLLELAEACSQFVKLIK